MSLKGSNLIARGSAPGEKSPKIIQPVRLGPHPCRYKVSALQADHPMGNQPRGVAPGLSVEGLQPSLKIVKCLFW